MEEDPFAILDPKKNTGYGPKPIPVEQDEKIQTLLTSYVRSSSTKTLMKKIRPEHWPVLEVFAERMASLAVRSNNVETPRIGLLALALAGLEEGSRDALIILALFYHACPLLGSTAARIFLSIGRVVGGHAAVELKAFLARSQKDKSLEVMGYEVGQDQDGFRYKRNW